MKKITLFLLLTILLMAAACAPEVRITGQSRELMEPSEADSSSEEFADIRKTLQAWEEGFRALLPEGFPLLDYQAAGQAAGDLLLDAQGKIRSYLKLAGSWIRIRDRAAALMESAGEYFQGFGDLAWGWWEQHKDETEAFAHQFGLEILDNLDEDFLQDFLEGLEIDWEGLQNLFTP